MKKFFSKAVIFLIFIYSISLSFSSPGDKAPVADARAGFSEDDVTQKYVYALVKETVYFDGSKSFDLDKEGSVKEYYWDFGDGFTDIGAKVQHEYSSKGNFTAKLMVIDNDDMASLLPSEIFVSITQGIKVEIKLPKDRSEFIQSADEKIKFIAKAEGGTPCYEEPYYKYIWKSDKSGIIGNEREFSLSPKKLQLGLHNITLEVEDCLGNKGKASITIAIVKPLKAEILETCEESFEGESMTLGRVVFDSSWLKFIPLEPYSKGIFSCNNSQYAFNIAKWLKQNGEILIYTSGGEYSKVEDLRNFLISKGYSVDIIEKTQEITYELLSEYGQVWFIDTEKDSSLEENEIDAIVKYHNNKGNLLLSGGFFDSEPYYAMINEIAKKFDVEMKAKLNVEADQENCVAPNFITHPLTENVEYLSSSGSDLFIQSLNPKTETIAQLNEKPYILVLDYETKTTGSKSYTCDCEIKFTGKAEGGMPPYEVKWISLEDGVFDRFWIKEDGGTYTLKTTPPLVPPLTNGTHTIKFEVTDSLGMKASDTRYEVYIKWCCALGADCKTYWPEHEGPMINTGNELSHSCDIIEVCHPDLWQLAREAIECCKWNCKGNCHEKCNYAYSEGAKLGTTPEGLTLDGLKKCAGLYVIYGFGPGERYMTDYFWPEICCGGTWDPFLAEYCLEGCCPSDVGKCRCIYHVYTKNQQALPCTGGVSTSPVGWSSDTAMNKNSCDFSDLSAHMSILGDEGLATEASGINTGTCCDYANSLTTMLRIVGYKPDEVYANTGPRHCYNLVKFPQDDKFHIIDTVGNCHKVWKEYTEPYVPYSLPTCVTGFPYCSYFNCRNDKGTFPCPQAYGC